MSKMLKFSLAVVLILVLSNFCWASCPEAPNDLGTCDTLFVAPSPHTDTCFISGSDTICINNPGQQFPCFWYVHLLVTHDSNTFWWSSPGEWVQDSIASFVIPLTWTRTNPSKYCSLSAYWNTNAYTGAGLTRSVFRDHGGMQNRMLDLQWAFSTVQVSTSDPYFRMSVIDFNQPLWWEGTKTLLATLTFKLQDTMTVAFDSTFWPSNSHLAFIRIDAQTYIPRLIQTEAPSETTLTADFSANPTSVAVACTVQFTDLSTGNPTSWFWDFGDGNTETLQNPRHPYADTGFYDVKLAVSNQTQTDTIIKYDYIHVMNELFSVSNYPVYGDLNWDVEPGDFNRDNNLDLTVISWNNEYGITRLWGHGDGTFTQQEHIPAFGYVLVKGYFNSDDFLDLALGSYDSLVILLNDGNGDFQPRYFPLHGLTGWSLAKGYLNSDAYLDLVTANMDTRNFSLFRGVGNGDFVFVKNLSIDANSVDIGDFNKDGKGDLVAGTDDSLIVFLGDGNWNFTRSSATYFGDIFSVTTMNSLADFNHDGNLDVIFALPHPGGADTSRIGILLGDGLGGFSSVMVLYEPDAQVYAVGASDFNGDNNLDFAASYAGNFQAVKVYFGDGAGNFPRRGLIEIGYASTSISTGDFNKDGNEDIVSGNTDEYVSVLYNLNPPKPAIEDEFVITGYTSINLDVTDLQNSTSANILANAIAGADYYQKDCNQDSALDDRVYHFNAVPGRYRVGVTLRPGTEPGSPWQCGIRIDGSTQVMIGTNMKDLPLYSGDTVFFIVTDSLPVLSQPADSACMDKDTLTLFWNEIGGTTQYHFQLDNNSDFSSPVIDDSAVTDTSLSLTSILSGRKYYWRVRSNGGVWSVFSKTHTFFFYSRGDVTCNGVTDLGDVVYLIAYLYKNGPEPNCLTDGDVNCDGVVTLLDLVYLINYLYRGGPPPPPHC